MMVNETNAHGRKMVHDMLQAIAAFRHGDMKISALLDHLWAQMHAQTAQHQPDLGEMEDAWTDMEIIYAQASEAGQNFLTASDATDLEDAIDRFIDVLRRTS